MITANGSRPYGKMSVHKIVYVGRHLKPYRIGFLKVMLEDFEVKVMIQSGSLLLDGPLLQNSFTYKNLVIRDVEGFQGRFPNLYFSPILYWKLFNSDAHLVIFEGTSASFFIASLLMRIKGVKVIVSFERTLHTERYNKWYRTIFHKIFLNYLANGILSNGVNSQKYLDFLGRKSLIYTRNVFPELPLHESNAYRDFDILFVGQLIHRKGFQHLLELVEFASQRIQIRVCIVGDGYFYDELYTKIRFKRNIKLLKKINNSDVIKLMARSKYLFLPTLEDNWSLVTFEAAVNGCVPITTKYNGAIDNDVFNFSNYVLYDFSSDFWSKKWKYLSSDATWRSLSENCLKLKSVNIYGDLVRYLKCF